MLLSNKSAEPGGGSPVPDPEWAWARYEPDADRPWDLPLAGHLYRRAGFGATWSQLQQAVAAGPQRIVDRLLLPEADVAVFNGEYDEYEGFASGSVESLRAWWLRRMIHTPHPLLEKMTLFWHDHFGISNVSVKDPRLMMGHVQLLRKHALGCFGPLLEGVSRDPAMLVGLGAQANRRALPNENLARQLMERFTLGPGQVGEEDVQEAARAFTGWFVIRGQLRFIDREHDAGVKRILGQEGEFRGEDVVRIVLKPPMASRLLVRKLYRSFVSETDEPADEFLQPLAEALARDYDMSAVVETILRSNWLYSKAAYRRRVKSPVEFALGIVRPLEGIVATGPLGNDLAALGQDLYHPPSVRGWEGGRYWVNDATIVGRSNLALALVAAAGAYKDKLDPMAVAEKHGRAEPERAVKLLVDLFLQGDVPAAVVDEIIKSKPAAEFEPTRWLREVTHTLTTLPEFQLA